MLCGLRIGLEYNSANSCQLEPNNVSHTHGYTPAFPAASNTIDEVQGDL